MTRGGDGEGDGVRELKTKEVAVKVDEEKVTIAHEEVQTESTKEKGTESSGEMKRKMKKKDIADTDPTGSGTAEPETGPEIAVMKSVM